MTTLADSAGSRPALTSRAVVVDEPRRTGRACGRTVGAYVALTKPRIIELLLVTTVPTMVLAAGGWPSLGAGARDAGRRHARRGQRQRAATATTTATSTRVMHRTARRPLARAHGAAARRAGLRPRPRRRRDRACSRHHQRAGRGARRGRDRLLRRRLHDAAQAAHLAEHRLGRRRRLHAGAHRLGGRDRLAVLGAVGAVRASSSSGRRRTSGRWRCATATTTPRAGVPMLPVVAAPQVVVARGSSPTPGRWWPPRCCWSPVRPARSTRSPPCCSARCSCARRTCCTPAPGPAARSRRCACSTGPSPTWRCCSSPSRSTSWSGRAGPRGRGHRPGTSWNAWPCSSCATAGSSCCLVDRPGRRALAATGSPIAWPDFVAAGRGYEPR